MALKLMGKKEGMTQIFDDDGQLVVCSVISMEPNFVVQVKTLKRDGYNAVQIGAIKVAESKKKNISKPVLGHFASAKVEPTRRLFESRTEGDDYQVGQEISIDHFANCPYVDVIGPCKGKGFQGVIKRYHFAGGPASHGSGFHRSGGSTGMRSTPGRCLPKVKKPGRMGAKRVTVEGLKVVRVDPKKKIVLVKGAIPGARGSLIWVREALKRAHKAKKVKKSGKV